MDENGRLKRDLHSVQNGNLRLLCQGKFAIWGKDMQKELLYSKKVREETEIQNKAAMILATMRKLHRRKCRCRGNLFFSSPWLSTPPSPHSPTQHIPLPQGPTQLLLWTMEIRHNAIEAWGRDHGVDSLQRSEIHERRAECNWEPTILQQRWHSPTIMHLLIIPLVFSFSLSKKL